jgi:diacylglycerol kinase
MRYAFTTQRNIRIQSTAGIVSIILAIWLGLSPLEFGLLIFTITMVLVTEMVNTVFETLVDLVTQEYHPLAEIAKDVGAAAVLTASLTAIVIGGVLFVPRLLALVTR